MKKYLFIFLSTFMLLVPGVKADEYDSCYDDYLINTTDLLIKNSRAFYNLSNDNWNSTTVNQNYTLKYLFSAESSKTYYLKFFSNYNDIKISYFYRYDSNKNLLDSTSAFVSKTLSDYLTYSYDVSNSMLIITFNNNIDFDYISFVFSVALSNFAYADFDLTTCPEKPDIPFNPGIQETEQSKIVTNFYTLFIDRFKFISDYAINSYFFLTFIGVILCFVILKIFLYLYNRGGYQ